MSFHPNPSRTWPLIAPRHCPSGIPEPATPPAATATATASEDHDHDHEESHTAATACEPHGDHWYVNHLEFCINGSSSHPFVRHCPSGIPEPSTPPALSAATTGVDHDDHVTATTCEPHGDHWHCPSGVAEPSTAPAAVTSPTNGASETPTTPTPSQFTGGAVMNGGSMAALLGAAGMLFV